ncbi:NADPH-dependent FMN reductase [Acetobacter thailandicus]|uniref:NADPH-dependent FMN reductase n=1 Tax=Acetobacter thailandicus TaxID=1502842 RepID=UPI001BAB4FF4|nr:NADPH-dependent FMN reductase [Acetobacter thailandicus]MBS0961330.1 NAD(P)H-dependent oxidoreductase [Acetobacter thailandicus]
MNKKYIGICGSIRSSSYSRIIMSYIQKSEYFYGRMNTIDISNIPHYSQDVESDNIPEEVKKYRNDISSSLGVIIVTPEYNHGMPGVLKNALDWFSRPLSKSCMHEKPAFFVTHSPGALGGVRAQYQIRETLTALSCRLSPTPEIAITYVMNKIDNNELNDKQIEKFLLENLKKYKEFSEGGC